MESDQGTNNKNCGGGIRLHYEVVRTTARVAGAVKECIDSVMAEGCGVAGKEGKVAKSAAAAIIIAPTCGGSMALRSMTPGAWVFIFLPHACSDLRQALREGIDQHAPGHILVREFTGEAGCLASRVCEEQGKHKARVRSWFTPFSRACRENSRLRHIAERFAKLHVPTAHRHSLECKAASTPYMLRANLLHAVYMIEVIRALTPG